MGNKFNRQIEFLDLISLASTGLQVYNTIENTQQSTNDDVIKTMLDENKRLLDEIIKDNRIILNAIFDKLDGVGEKDVAEIEGQSNR